MIRAPDKRASLEVWWRHTCLFAAQDNLQHITFGKLTKRDLHSFSEEQLIKLFELAQLTMEYLLSVQATLANNESALREQCEMLRLYVRWCMCARVCMCVCVCMCARVSGGVADGGDTCQGG